MTDEIIGRHATCRGTVVFIDEGTAGWRFCLGCTRRGPDVMLESEVPVVELEVGFDEFESPDVTFVGEPPPDLLAMARRSR